MKLNAKFFASAIAILSASVLTASAQQITDDKLKKNTTPVSNAINDISRLQPVVYEYNNSDFKQLNLPAGKQYGFIATDAKDVAPYAITTRNTWYNAGKNNPRAVTTAEVDLEKLVPLLVGAIKEQQTEIEKLKSEVQTLKQAK